ncbi:MAG TPA: hypothetical protein VIY49_17235 [Bryobacteraceae bacterium]
MRVSSTLFLFPALFALSQLAPAEDAKDVQQKLGSKYKLTVINAEGGVVIPGATLVLKLNGLVAGAMSACVNDYKDGKVTVAKGPCGASSALGKIRCPPLVPGCAGRVPDTSGTRNFVMGEKVYVTKIDVKDGINFAVVSDAINNVVYKAEVRFQFPKGTAPDSAKADQLAGEVFTISQDNPQGGGGAAGGQAPAGQTPAPAAAPAPAPEPQPAALPPIEPPPPPTDAPAAPPPTVSLGMTIDQVVAILGQPKLIVEPTKNKKIYTYPALKVTFVDGKVSDVQ